jgi:hypothetical protein
MGFPRFGNPIWGCVSFTLPESQGRGDPGLRSLTPLASTGLAATRQPNIAQGKRSAALGTATHKNHIDPHGVTEEPQAQSQGEHRDRQVSKEHRRVKRFLNKRNRLPAERIRRRYTPGGRQTQRRTAPKR